MSVDLEKYTACLFTLEYCGKSRRLKEFQLTTYWIGKIFNIFPDSIVLVGSDGTTEVPDETGQFTLLSQYLEYEVQGDSSTTEGNVEPAVSSYAFPYSTYKPYAGKKAIVKQTGYKHKGPVSKPPGVVSQETVESGSKLPKKEEWEKNVEICAYTENGRLKKISNFPMTLTNDTAKVDFIAESISQELFDGTVVFLIDVDNLKIRDSTVTRGSRYWKSARRIKALTKGDYELLHGREDPFDKEGSDDDFMTSHKSKHTLSLKKPVKKSTETGQLDVLEGRVSVVEDVIKDWRRHEDNKEELRRELADCKDSIKAMECELSAKRRKLADAKAFVDAIQENMCCLICKTISSGDCVVFPCCKQFGTCYSCIHEWLLESSSCPHCTAQMEIDCCIKLPDAVQLRAIFSTIQTFKQFNDDVIIEL